MNILNNRIFFCHLFWSYTGMEDRSGWAFARAADGCGGDTEHQRHDVCLFTSQ